MTAPPALLIRADAGPEIGVGHVMRCFALGQAWQDLGGVVHYATALNPPSVAEWLKAEGGILHFLSAAPGSPEDASQTRAVVGQINPQWTVIDGYHFDGRYQQAMKETGGRLLMLDDFGQADNYVADFVLNQNSYAAVAMYPRRSATTKLLLGTDYALLRRQFQEWRGSGRDANAVARKILVTLGGSDPHDVTRTILSVLQSLEAPELEIKVIVGPANRRGPSLEREFGTADEKIKFYFSANDMPRLMAWADLVVTAAGSTCWELCCLGLPMLLIVTADNQKLIAEDLAKRGVAETAGWYERLSPQSLGRMLKELLSGGEQRRAMSAEGRKLVDGRGASRIAHVLRTSVE